MSDDENTRVKTAVDNLTQRSLRKHLRDTVAPAV